MSSSAFTPSTTTVTNNVPVNVPVVTAWEAYTPIITGLGTVSNLLVQYSRIGGAIHVKGSLTGGTPTASNFSISLPTGLSATTSLGNSKQIIGKAQVLVSGVTTVASYTDYQSLFIDPSTDTTVIYAGYQTGSGIFVKNPGNTFVSAGNSLTFDFTVPISQWAGSGTTTLATRAVEEYVSHDGTSIVRGAAGSLVPNVAASINTTSYTVDFSQSSQSTDAVILEYSRNNLGWQNAADFAPFFGGNNSSATNLYGVRIYKSSATQYVVEFGNQGTRVQASNISAGATSWADERIAGTRFRLRKVSGGAQVGYPVSARNIVGDTSGTVVPTGMIGETLKSNPASGVAVAATTAFAQITSLTLTPGVWAVTATAQIAPGTISGWTYYQVNISTSSGTNDSNNNGGTFAGPPSSGGFSQAVGTRFFNVSINTPVYLVGRIDYSSQSGSVWQINSTLQAIRIA